MQYPRYILFGIMSSKSIRTIVHIVTFLYFVYFNSAATVFWLSLNLLNGSPTFNFPPAVPVRQTGHFPLLYEPINKTNPITSPAMNKEDGNHPPDSTDATNQSARHRSTTFSSHQQLLSSPARAEPNPYLPSSISQRPYPSPPPHPTLAHTGSPSRLAHSCRLPGKATG